MNQETIQPLLTTLKRELQRHYGQRLSALYLFGSYARGDARPESDVDILAVLNEDEVSPYHEIDALGDILYQLELDHDKLIGFVPASKRLFATSASLLYKSVKREGKLV